MITRIWYETFRIQDRAPAASKSLAEQRLREKFSVTVLAIQRHDETWVNLWGGTQLQARDLVIALGKPTQRAETASLFRR